MNRVRNRVKAASKNFANFTVLESSRDPAGVLSDPAGGAGVPRSAPSRRGQCCQPADPLGVTRVKTLRLLKLGQ